MLTTAPGLSERRYNFHGFGITLTGESRLVESFDARLKLFRSAATGLYDELIWEVGTDRLTRPAGTPRPVYDPDLGEVVYDDVTDELFLAIDDRLRAQCKPVQGWTGISFCDPSPRNQWRVSHPLLTLPLIEMLKRRGLYSLHAAGVSRDGHGLLLVGGSGSGKTTLAIALARAAFDFLGDDMLFLYEGREQVNVLAFPDEVDVTATTASFFPELWPLIERPRRPGWPKWSFRAETFLNTRVAWACLPAAVVFPRVADLQTSRLEPMRPDQALLEIAPNVLLTEPSACQQHLDALARLVNETPCYRLATGRDLDALPELLGKLIRNG